MTISQLSHNRNHTCSWISNDFLGAHVTEIYLWPIEAITNERSCNMLCTVTAKGHCKARLSQMIMISDVKVCFLIFHLS